MMAAILPRPRLEYVWMSRSQCVQSVHGEVELCLMFTANSLKAKKMRKHRLKWRHLGLALPGEVQIKKLRTFPVIKVGSGILKVHPKGKLVWQCY